MHKKGTWLMAGGLLLMAAALLLTGYNLWDERRATASADSILLEMPAEIRAAEPAAPAPEPEDPDETEIPDYILNPNMDMPTVEVDGHAYIGVVRIPVLGLELPVMSEWSYPNLKTAPCRYTGSAYLGNLILAAHNYRTHFGGLKELVPGDEVTFTDAVGNVFRYTVAELETLGKTDVEEMQAGDWSLTLFTCTYGGKSRVTVRCVPAESGAAY